MEVFDILLDTDYTIQIANGDLVVGDATQQNQKLLLISNPGEWKQTPDAGVGIINYIQHENAKDALSQKIQNEFEKDGMRIKRLNLDDLTKAEIEAEYK